MGVRLLWAASGIAGRVRFAGRGGENREGADGSRPHGRKTPSGLYKTCKRVAKVTLLQVMKRPAPVGAEENSLGLRFASGYYFFCHCRVLKRDQIPFYDKFGCFPRRSSEKGWSDGYGHCLECPSIVELFDGPCRIRTYNQRIMSPLL